MSTSTPPPDSGKPFAVRLRAELRKQLEEIAERERRPLGQFIRMELEKVVDRRKRKPVAAA